MSFTNCNWDCRSLGSYSVAGTDSPVQEGRKEGGREGRKEGEEGTHWKEKWSSDAVLGEYFPDSPFMSLQVCCAQWPLEGLFSNSGILECLPDQTQDIASYVFYQKPRQVWGWHENLEGEEDWARLELLWIFHGSGIWLMVELDNFLLSLFPTSFPFLPPSLLNKAALLG